jgi:hypothetical protein
LLRLAKVGDLILGALLVDIRSPVPSRSQALILECRCKELNSLHMLTANIRLRSSRPRKAWLLELVAAMGAALALPAVSQAQAMRAPYDPGTRVMQPRIFAEGTISTDLDESGGAFSPDGKDFYFTVLAPYTTAPRFGMICVSHFKDGRWQTPKTVSFSGQYLDLAPRLSADGNKLYFTSVRPTRESKALRYRIWVA